MAMALRQSQQQARRMVSLVRRTIVTQAPDLLPALRRTLAPRVSSKCSERASQLERRFIRSTSGFWSPQRAYCKSVAPQPGQDHFKEPEEDDEQIFPWDLNDVDEEVLRGLQHVLGHEYLSDATPEDITWPQRVKTLYSGGKSWRLMTSLVVENEASGERIHAPFLIYTGALRPVFLSGAVLEKLGVDYNEGSSLSLKVHGIKVQPVLRSLKNFREVNVIGAPMLTEAKMNLVLDFKTSTSSYLTV